MYIPGLITFAFLSVGCLAASAYWFRKPAPRLPEWRWLSLLLAAAFGGFALSFARPSSHTRIVAEGLLALAGAAELIIALRRDRGRSKDHV